MMNPSKSEAWDEAIMRQAQEWGELMRRMKEREEYREYDYGKDIIARLQQEAKREREESGVMKASRGNPSRKRTVKPSQTSGGKWRGHTGEKPDPRHVTSMKEWSDGGVTYICQGGQVVYVP